MSAASQLDQDKLIATLREVYGLEVSAMELVPKGSAAFIFVLRCAGGERYFLKLHDTRRHDATASTDPRFYLQVAEALFTQDRFRNLPRPIRTRAGYLQGAYSHYTTTLFTYIAGRTLEWEHPCPAEHLLTLARMVGRIHAATPELGVEHTHVERFDPPFRPLLPGCLRDLALVGDGARPSQAELRDLLLPRIGEMQALLTRLSELEREIELREHEMVLCHTDLHGANLMLGDDGELYILDWENAMIAPREHDLFTFWNDDLRGVAHPRFEGFLTAYQETAGPVVPDLDLMQYYRIRRNLEDMTAFMMTILYEDDGAESDRADLGWIRIGLEEWPDPIVS